MQSTDEGKPCGDARSSEQILGAGPAPRCRLIRVSAGMAAGTARRVHGSVLAEWWTLFVSHDQVEASLTVDPLRFEDPILFAQLRRKLDHAFLYAEPRIDPGSRSSTGLRVAGSGSDCPDRPGD